MLIIHRSSHPWLSSDPSLFVYSSLRLPSTLPKLFCLSALVSLSMSVLFDLSEEMNIKEKLFPPSGALFYFPSSVFCPLFSFTAVFHRPLSSAQAFFPLALDLLTALELGHCTVTFLASGLVRNLLNANLMSELRKWETAVCVKGVGSNYFFIKMFYPWRLYLWKKYLSVIKVLLF